MDCASCLAVTIAAGGVQAGLNLRSLASAGIPPSAPDLMSGALTMSTAHDTEPAHAKFGGDAPYTPSAAVPSDPTASAVPAASVAAKSGRRDPRGRASAGAAVVEAPAPFPEPAATAQPDHAVAAPPSEGEKEMEGVEEVDLAKTLASMAPADSAAILESIMRDAPDVRFSTTCVPSSLSALPGPCIYQDHPVPCIS